MEIQRGQESNGPRIPKAHHCVERNPSGATGSFYQQRRLYVSVIIIQIRPIVSCRAQELGCWVWGISNFSTEVGLTSQAAQGHSDTCKHRQSTILPDPHSSLGTSKPLNHITLILAIWDGTRTFSGFASTIVPNQAFPGCDCGDAIPYCFFSPVLLAVASSVALFLFQAPTFWMYFEVRHALSMGLDL